MNTATKRPSGSAVILSGPRTPIALALPLAREPSRSGAICMRATREPGTEEEEITDESVPASTVA
ncbi:MAG: hypothetical protein ACKOXX_08025, partial [Actinomycetota bacterium]